PDKYDGTPNSQTFIRFMSSASMYLEYTNFPKKARVYILSQFLTGKAYNFYLREIAPSPKSWTLRKFFIGLFNYCFPATYRTEQRRKLDNCSQGKHSVRDYAAFIMDLYLTVGVNDERERVVRFWNGLDNKIQSRLWGRGLNPEMSSWRRV
ncbi:hypothetical protein BDN72DRAFT_737570, partial [Pluteus cervinus]